MRLWLTDYHVVSLVSQTPFSSLHKVVSRESKQDFLAETFDLTRIPIDEQHRFRECIELYRRSNCDNLMKIYQLVEGTNKQRLTIIMQQHGDMTLAALYESYKQVGLAVPEPILWNTLAQVISALQALRKQDAAFFHANVHPANCFIDEQTNKLRLGLFLPFALKYEEEEASTRESITSLIERAQRKIKGMDPALTSCVQNFTDYGRVLTLILPPEVFRGNGILTVSDMWMVGCLLFEGCNGCNPFTEGLEVIASPSNQLQQKSSELSSRLADRSQYRTLDKSSTLSQYITAGDKIQAPESLNNQKSLSAILEGSMDIALGETHYEHKHNGPTKLTHYKVKQVSKLASMALMPSLSFTVASSAKNSMWDSTLHDNCSVQYDFRQFAQHVLNGKRSATNSTYSRNLQLIIDMCLNGNIKMRMTLDTLARHPILVKFLSNTKDEMTIMGKFALYSEKAEKSIVTLETSLNAKSTAKIKEKRRIDILDLEEPVSGTHLGPRTTGELSESVASHPRMDSDDFTLSREGDKYPDIKNIPVVEKPDHCKTETYLTSLQELEQSSNLFSDELESICSVNISSTDESSSTFERDTTNSHTVVCDFDNLISGKREEEPCTILMIAALRNDVDLIKNNRRSDIRQRCLSGKTALMFAAQQGNVEAVKLLLKEAGMKKRTGKTALMIAAEQGYHEVVAELVGKEAGMQDKDRWTALMRAAWFGKAQCCKYLLEEEGRFTRKNGWTALMCAAYRGHAAVCKVLVAKEAEMYTTAGYTALMYAARYGHYECCKILAPYEFGMKNRHWQTALTIAAERQYGKIAMLLLKAETDFLEQKKTALQLSQSQMSHCTPVGSIRNSPHGGSVGIVTPYLNKKPVNLNNTDRFSNFLDENDRLHLSDLGDQPEGLNYPKASSNEVPSPRTPSIYRTSSISFSTKDLLANNSSFKLDSKSVSVSTSKPNSRPTSADNRGKGNISSSTFRLNALLSGHVKPLLRQRSDFRTNCSILVKKDETLTEMMEAALDEDLQKINKLISRQAALRTERGRTGLMLCAEKGLIHSVRMLTAREATIQDNCGWTALMYAATMEHEAVVHFLSECEARIQDNVGNTALMLAAQYGHSRIVKLLMKQEVCMRDKNGWTALIHAINTNNVACVKLLMGEEFGIADEYQLTALDHCKDGPIRDILVEHYLGGV